MDSFQLQEMSDDEEGRRLLQDDDVNDNQSDTRVNSLGSVHSGAHQDFSRSIDKNVIPEDSATGRHLSWHSAYILVISRVIGSGIFATPGAIVRAAGSIGLSMLVWVLGAVFAACGLALTLEYGCMLPRSGGDKVYLEYTYRYPRFLASTIIAVTAVLLGFTASNCIVFAEYVLFAFDVEPVSWMQKSLAVGLLTTIVVIHSCLPKVGIVIQNILGWIKVVLIIFMILAGLFVVAFRRDTSSGHAPLTWNHLWEGSDWSWGVIATSAFKALYTYAGLNNVNMVMNDVKNPVRTLKSVSITAFWTAFLLYILINIAYFIVIPIDEIKSSGELIAALFFEKSFGPKIGKTLLPIAVALSAAGNVMVTTYALARVNQEIARQGFFPFSHLLASSKPFNAPMGGFVVHYIPSFLVITLPPSKDAYSFILDVEAYPRQFFVLALCSGLIWLRYREPDLKRPFKAWISAVVLMMGMSLALAAAPFFPPSEQENNGGLFYATYALVGVSILLLGVVYWYIGFVLVPRWKGYRIEEVADVLDDGVTVTRLVKVPYKGDNSQLD